MWAEVRQTWVKLSASEGSKLDKLRPDGIHIKRDGTGRITHSLIFEITRANDIFANRLWGDKVAQKTLRYEALRVALERATTASCYLSIFRARNLRVLFRKRLAISAWAI